MFCQIHPKTTTTNAKLPPFTGNGWIGYLAPLLTKHFGTLLWGEPGNLFTFITPMWVFFFCSTTTLHQQLNAYTHISWMNDTQFEICFLKRIAPIPPPSKSGPATTFSNTPIRITEIILFFFFNCSNCTSWKEVNLISHCVVLSYFLFCICLCKNIWQLLAKNIKNWWRQCQSVHFLNTTFR